MKVRKLDELSATINALSVFVFSLFFLHTGPILKAMKA